MSYIFSRHNKQPCPVLLHIKLKNVSVVAVSSNSDPKGLEQAEIGCYLYNITVLLVVIKILFAKSDK